MGAFRGGRLLAVCAAAVLVAACKPTTGSPGIEPPAVKGPASLDAGSSSGSGFNNQPGAIGTTATPGSGAQAPGTAGGTGTAGTTGAMSAATGGSSAPGTTPTTGLMNPKADEDAGTSH